MAMTKTAIRLGDLGTGHVWFVSVGQPAGCDLVAEDGEPLELPGCDPDTGDSRWWELTGTVEGDRWEWDGEGKPHDWQRNSVLRIVAFVPEGSTPLNSQPMADFYERRSQSGREITRAPTGS